MSGAIDLKKVAGVFVLVLLWAGACYWHVHARTRSDRADEFVALGIGVPNYVPLDFQTLSSFRCDTVKEDFRFNSDTPPKSPGVQIPLSITALSGKRFAIRGMMISNLANGSKTTEFMLLYEQQVGCGPMGRLPRMNECIDVRMKSGTETRILASQPVTIYGTLTVGEFFENGELKSIYRMDDCEDVAGPLDL